MDFMPKWDISAPKEIKRQGIEEMKQTLMEIANAQNRNVARQGNKSINKKKL